MNTLDIISSIIKNMKGNGIIFDNRDAAQKVHDCLHNWIIDKTTTYKSISDLFNDMKRERFFGNLGFRDLVVLTCLEGIANRRPKPKWKHQVIKHALEDLIFILIPYHDMIDFYGIMYGKLGIIDLKCVKKWLRVYCTLSQCPNPYLRLELLSLMYDLKVLGNPVSRGALIATLYERGNSISSLKNKNMIRCTASCLRNIMKFNLLNMKSIFLSYHTKESEYIIDATIKIANMFAIKENEDLKIKGVSDPEIVLSCLEICGLLTDVAGYSIDKDTLSSFATIVCKNHLLKASVANTLQLKNKSVTAFKYQYAYNPSRGLSEALSARKRILILMVSTEARLLPMSKNLLPQFLSGREMNGITQPITEHLLYFATLKNKYFSKVNIKLNMKILHRDVKNDSEYAYLQEQSQHYDFSEISDSSEEDNNYESSEDEGSNEINVNEETDESYNEEELNESYDDEEINESYEDEEINERFEDDISSDSSEDENDSISEDESIENSWDELPDLL